MEGWGFKINENETYENHKLQLTALKGNSENKKLK